MVIIISREKKWLLDWTFISVWIFSSLILTYSFYHQYVEKIEPCSLCKWQRLVYVLVFVLSPIGIFKCFNVSMRNALKLIFLIGFCLAIYHAMVQFGLLIDHCTMTQKIENTNDFMKMLEQPKVACSAISWKLFGLSASIYNAIFSLVALIFLHFNHNLKAEENGEICQKNSLLQKNN